MEDREGKGRYPQDLVAIFHASFHPTKGNIIDWSLKASDDLNLEHLQLEFSALPSGLHLVEQDVVYFTKENQCGVCVFRRRQTDEHGHRGFRLSSLGVLLAKSVRARPWRHIKALKDLIDTLYSQTVNRGHLDMTEEDWEPARTFFEERKLRRADLGGAGDWIGWSDELDGASSNPLDTNPTIHLPHLLRILGPSSLTLYKHVLGRRRILIYTLPPVEVACILCQVAGDFCFDIQVRSESEISLARPRGRRPDPISVLGMITLADLDRLETETKTGRGWIACTTDAIFMEKPSYYDLLIDLTTSTPNTSTRPTFYSSKLAYSSQPGSLRSPTHRLSTIRFAWSDIKLWTEIDRILQLDSEASHNSCCTTMGEESYKPKTITLWTDAWRIYEDVCVICAGLWIGSWRDNSTASYSTSNGPENWGSVRLEGDDDLSLRNALKDPGIGSENARGKLSMESQRTYVRSLGMGIEGRPVDSLGGAANKSTTRRASAMSWSSGKATVVGTVSGNGKARQLSTSTSPGSSAIPDSGEGTYAVALNRLDPEHAIAEERARRRLSQVYTTMALLQTFHAHTTFQLSVLEDLLRAKLPNSPNNGSASASRTVVYASDQDIPAGEQVIVLTPKDFLAFELGPFSSLDARYLEWLAEQYAGGEIKVVVKRSWRDLLGVFFGYG